MTAIKKFRLQEIEWPDFGIHERPPQPGVEEFEKRLNATREAMAKLNLSHLIFYGDREHFANLTYLTGFDPRFEEALLIISPQDKPLLLVGNECEGYLTISPLYVAEKLRGECFQPFSLLSQPRDNSRFIKTYLPAKVLQKAPASAASVGSTSPMRNTPIVATPLNYRPIS